MLCDILPLVKTGIETVSSDIRNVSSLRSGDVIRGKCGRLISAFGVSFSRA